MSNQPPSTPSSSPSLASRGIQPRFGELMQACHKLVMNRLAEHLSGVFGQVDDTLFECAEKAENNQVQTLFFDSMRDIRKQRTQIERTYHQQIAQNFADFIDGKLQPLDLPGQLDADKLSLVQNEDYEESLLVTNMASRVKARCAQQLFALEQRLALLNNGKKLSEDGNPFGPQAIAQTFRDALTPTPFPLRIKTILYMLFDQHMMQNLDGLYEALNQRLIGAGVLPNLKYSAQRASSRTRPTTSSTPEPKPEASDEPASTEQPAAHNSVRTTQPSSPSSLPAKQTGLPATSFASTGYQAAEPGDLSGPPSNDPAVLFSGLPRY